MFWNAKLHYREAKPRRAKDIFISSQRKKRIEALSSNPFLSLVFCELLRLPTIYHLSFITYRLSLITYPYAILVNTACTSSSSSNLSRSFSTSTNCSSVNSTGDTGKRFKLAFFTSKPISSMALLKLPKLV